MIDTQTQRGYVFAACDRSDCDFMGVMHSTRRTTEGHRLAERDAQRHEYAHVNHVGFFHHMKGWTAS